MVAVQVQIQSSRRVIPSQPTPNGNFLMSYCEQIKVSTHGSQLYFYKPCSTSHDASNLYVETLRTSLSQALVHYYPFAGRLSWINGARMELHCNAMGVPLLEASCDASLADLGDFAEPNQIQQQFVPMFDYSCPIEQMPLMMAQLTRFQCGGLVLGLAFCRALVDGAAVANFIKSWQSWPGESL
ncbi:hypothetical protein L6164_004806 [Bauhinia variegata]|uniref:Uncharacterized protein n=1 Tax=Bauhinia variegata TaxID=167791 RepID=A0ACB9PRI5_BAUVA|nr:hypothetical protein L6164_004806 [Bauhinia variegata]